MIANLIRLIPAGHRGRLISYVQLSLLSVTLRAASCLLLVPRLGALFGPAAGDALPWLAALTAVTATGWIVDMVLARVGYGIGFALVNNTQKAMADRLTDTPLGWFTAENTAMARQAIA